MDGGEDDELMRAAERDGETEGGEQVEIKGFRGLGFRVSKGWKFRQMRVPLAGLFLIRIQFLSWVQFQNK